MYAVIVGCGQLGAELASRLYRAGHEVAIVDQTPAAFQTLDPAFRGRIVEGDVLSQDVQRRAEFQRADAVAAVTNVDTVNAVIAHVARMRYRVDKVVARNYDPRILTLHETFGHTVVASTVWGARNFEELLSRPAGGAAQPLFVTPDGSVAVHAVGIPAGWDGRPLEQLLAGLEVSAVSLTRGARSLLPAAGAPLATGDIVHLSATRTGIEALRGRLAERSASCSS